MKSITRTLLFVFLGIFIAGSVYSQYGPDYRDTLRDTRRAHNDFWGVGGAGSRNGSSPSYSGGSSSSSYSGGSGGYKSAEDVAYDSGNKFLKQGDYDSAIQEFSKAIRIDPTRPHYYVNRGKAYAKKGDYDQVIADCTEAIRIDITWSTAYQNRGAAYYYKGNYDLALVDFSMLILYDSYNDKRLEWERPGYYADRGFLYYKMGNYDKAIEDFETALSLEPDSTTYKKYLDDARVQASSAPAVPAEAVRAEEAAEEAVKKFRRQLAEKYCDDGEAHEREKRWNNADREYTKAIRIDPEYEEAYYFRGYVNYMLGYNDRAVDDCTKAISLNPKRVESYNNRGMAYFYKGNYDDAIVDIEVAIRLDPNDTTYKKNLEYVQKVIQQIADYTEAIRLKPSTSDYYSRGEIYYKNHNYDKAIADYEAGRHLKPSNSTYERYNSVFSQAYNERGLAYYKNGNYEKAIADYKAALRLMPKDATIKENLEDAQKELKEQKQRKR